MGSASREYAILTPHANWAEQDAERVWKLAWEALAQAVEQGKADPPKAMALSVQGEAVIPVDKAGRPLRNAILGSGVTRPGLAMASTGTAEVVEVAMASPVVDRKLREGNISVYRHVVPDLYLVMTLNHSGGLTLRRFRDTLCQDKCMQAAKMATDAYDLILAAAPDKPTDLLACPTSPAPAPLLDTQSRGAIVGMTFAITQADIAKAIGGSAPDDMRHWYGTARQSPRGDCSSVTKTDA